MALKRKPSPKRKSRKSFRRKPSPKRKSIRRKPSPKRKSPRRNRGGMNTSSVEFKEGNYYQQPTNQYKRPIVHNRPVEFKEGNYYQQPTNQYKRPTPRYVLPTQIRPLPPKSKSSTRTNKQKDPVFYTDLYLLNQKFPLELKEELKQFKKGKNLFSTKRMLL